MKSEGTEGKCLTTLYNVRLTLQMYITIYDIVTFFFSRKAQNLASPWVPWQNDNGIFPLHFGLQRRFMILTCFVLQDNLHKWAPYLWFLKLKYEVSYKQTTPHCMLSMWPPLKACTHLTVQPILNVIWLWQLFGPRWARSVQVWLSPCWQVCRENC